MPLFLPSHLVDVENKIVTMSLNYPVIILRKEILISTSSANVDRHHLYPVDVSTCVYCQNYQPSLVSIVFK